MQYGTSARREREVDAAAAEEEEELQSGQFKMEPFPRALFHSEKSKEERENARRQCEMNVLFV